MNAKEFVEKFGVHYDKDACELKDKDDNSVEINDGNLEDYACPKCGDRGYFEVEVTAKAELCDSGIGDTINHDYNSESMTECLECNHRTELGQFCIPGLDRLLQEIYDKGNEEEDEEEEEESEPESTPEPEQEPPPSTTPGWDTTGI